MSGGADHSQNVFAAPSWAAFPYRDALPPGYDIKLLPFKANGYDDLLILTHSNGRHHVDVTHRQGWFEEMDRSAAIERVLRPMIEFLEAHVLREEEQARSADR